MTIIQKLTLENLRKNKKRTVVTILGILLSSALICAVAGLAASGRESVVRWIRQTEGDFHMLYTDLPAEDLKYAAENAHVTRRAVFSQLGYARMETSANEYKPYYYVYAMGDDAFQTLAIHLEKGRLPENDREIVVSRAVITSGGVSVSVGDTLALEIGTRRNADGGILTQRDPFDPEGAPETITDTVLREYTVVGLIDRPGSLFENYNAPGFTLITYREGTPSEGLCGTAVTFDRAASFSEYENQIDAAIEAADPGIRWNAVANSTLLKFEGALSANTLNAIYSLAAIILVIIIVTSVFVIRNAFAISVSEKNRQYGMLAAVGATARQIRHSILFEGLLMGLIGIPLGILLGVAAIAILIRILNLLLYDIFAGIFIFILPPAVILLTVLLSALTIFLSCLIPAIRAGRIPPIEAIRSSREIRIRRRKLRTSRLTEKLFGIGGVIAAKNLKRSRSKYRTTVISLVVSISVFITLASFVAAGETSREAVEREVREETGLDLSDCPGEVALTYRRDNPEEGDNYFVDVWQFRLDFTAADIRLQAEESMDFRIADPKEIRELADRGIFLHYKSIEDVFA